MISEAEWLLIHASLEEMEQCLRELDNCSFTDERIYALIRAAVIYARDNKAMYEEEPEPPEED